MPGRHTRHTDDITSLIDPQGAAHTEDRGRVRRGATDPAAQRGACPFLVSGHRIDIDIVDTIPLRYTIVRIIDCDLPIVGRNKSK